jgi:hypothetical protein
MILYWLAAIVFGGMAWILLDGILFYLRSRR